MKPLVSIDVFDTAIFREVFYPTDIFNLIEDEVGRDFKAQRLEAQSKAIRKVPYYSILDVYKFLPTFDIKDEIKAEYQNCEANPYILNMYNEGLYDYIFISDMYLSSSIIKSMLEKCGYSDPQVFVSCEQKASKVNGLLFRKVEELLGRKIEKHIGDSYQADILGAKKAKIEEVEYVGPAIYERKIQIPELKSQKLRKILINAELNSNFSIEEKMGYKFAPLAVAFVKEVLDEATDNQTVYFNARDGFLLYIIARWVLKTNKRIKYCRFSRKSCHFPNINTNFNLNNSVNEKAMNFFRNLRVQSLRDFVEMFNIENDFTKELNTLGVTLDSYLDFSKDKNKVLLDFVQLIQNTLYSKARQERKNFIEYIKNLGMKDNDIFVDLGHFGSMQSIIRKVAHKILKGRYLHMFDTKIDYLKDIKEDKESFLPKGSMFYYTGVIETIFSEPRGTVVSYTEDGFPILSNDKKFRVDVIKKLAKGVLEGAKELVAENVEVPYEDCIKIAMNFLEEPTLEEATFGNSELFENGSYENNESLTWFREDYIKQGRLKDCYNRSYWKSGFKVLLRNSKYSNLERFLK